MLNGNRILLSRRDLDMNQDELARLAGVSQAYVSGIERGSIANPTLEVMEGLARALGVSLAYLLDLSDDPLGKETPPDDQVLIEVKTPEERRLLGEVAEELRSLDAADQQLALALIRQIRRSRAAR